MTEIEELGSRIRGCHRCRLARTRRHALAGEGDPGSRIMLVALSPGEKEDRRNRMFIGPSGEVLNRLLNAARVKREEVYMTNLIKCNLPKNRRPRRDEIESCRIFLDQEINLIKPAVIVPLGFYATRYVLQKFHASVPETRRDFATIYGKLVYSSDQKIFPLPHPASLLYNPAFEPATRKQYRKLRVFLHPCRRFSSCPLNRFCRQGRVDPKWMEQYCRGDWESCRRFILEEQGKSHPDCMLPDGSLNQWLECEWE